MRVYLNSIMNNTIADIVYLELTTKILEHCPGVVTTKGSNYKVFENSFKRCTVMIKDNTIFWYRLMDNEFEFDISLSDPDAINKVVKSIIDVLSGKTHID